MVETLRIDICGLITDVNYENIESYKIESENIVGDTVFVKSKGNPVFSVNKKDWFVFKRNKNIKDILN
jgi:hypothetical protein